MFPSELLTANKKIMHVYESFCTPLCRKYQLNQSDLDLILFIANSTLHTDEGHSIHIGKGVSIGHNAVVHGCTVGDNTVVGMGSIILSGAVVGKNCIIGAGALVTGKMVIPDNSMAFGNPAKVVRQLTAEEVEDNRHNAQHYVDLMNK